MDTDHLQYKDEAPQKMKWIQKGEATKKKFIDSFLVDSPVKRKLIADLETGLCYLYAFIICYVANVFCKANAREERIKRAKKALQPVKAEASSSASAGPSSSKAPKKGAAKDKKDGPAKVRI